MLATLKSDRIKSRREDIIREVLRARKFSKIKLFEDAISFVEEGLEIANKRNEILDKVEKEWDAVAIFIRNKEILDFNYMNDKANKIGISSDFNQFLDDMKNVNLNK